MSVGSSVDIYIETRTIPGLGRSLAVLADSTLCCILALASTQRILRIAEIILGPAYVTEFVEVELGIVVCIADW
jgi:hypothetical protein